MSFNLLNVNAKIYRDESLNLQCKLTSLYTMEILASNGFRSAAKTYEKQQARKLLWLSFKGSICHVVFLVEHEFLFSPSRPNLIRRQKISFWKFLQVKKITSRCLKRFYEGLKGLHKTFWGTTNNSEINI